MLTLSLAMCSSLLVPGFAQEKKKPAVKKIGATRYRLGEIEFDAKTKEIFLPVVVNQNEGGPMEYILVHENGKVHESIFTTKVRPLELQIVFKLLKFRPGKGDLFDALLPENERASEGGRKSERGDLIDISVRWSDGGETVTPNDLILDARSAKPMSPGGWIFTGSEIYNGTFMAETEGSLVAVYLDPVAMLNMTGKGADDDERWGANKGAIPEIGTRGTMILRLSKKQKNHEK